MEAGHVLPNGSWLVVVQVIPRLRSTASESQRHRSRIFIKKTTQNIFRPAKGLYGSCLFVLRFSIYVSGWSRNVVPVGSEFVKYTECKTPAVYVLQHNKTPPPPPLYRYIYCTWSRGGGVLNWEYA
jgi:hypothetical protein